MLFMHECTSIGHLDIDGCTRMYVHLCNKWEHVQHSYDSVCLLHHVHSLFLSSHVGGEGWATVTAREM